MLTKCPECQKDVSSEAASCPHCGFPLKSAPKEEAIPVRESNSSKSGLGVFFIFLAMMLAIGGYIVNRPSESEGLQRQLVNTSQDGERTANGFSAFTGDSSSANKFHQDAMDERSDLDGMISARHRKAMYFFVSAGALFVLGLVLRVSGKPSE